MTWLIGCEESGTVRDAFLARGIDAVSCDLKPTRSPGPHIQGDILEAINSRKWAGAILFPDCTYLTCSAEWAYGDGPYHQRVKPGTLVGAARRQARERAIKFVLRLWNCGLDRVAIENPVGVLSQHLGRPPTYQPYEFGDDASKRTCLWVKGLPPLMPLPRYLHIQPRIVGGNPRWANQTDSGQNRLSPGVDRARDRSVTYPGIAAAMANQWSGLGSLAVAA